MRYTVKRIADFEMDGNYLNFSAVGLENQDERLGEGTIIQSRCVLPLS